jgi:hypothetical protein
MHPLALGKRKRSANKPTQTLAERVVETLDIARLTVALIASRMLLVRNHSLIRLPKICEAMLATISDGNATPKATARLYRPLSDSVAHNLARATTDRKPQPDVVTLVLNKRPHLVKL